MFLPIIIQHLPTLLEKHCATSAFLKYTLGYYQPHFTYRNLLVSQRVYIQSNTLQVFSER